MVDSNLLIKLHDDNIKINAKVEDLGSDLACEFIRVYVNNMKDKIDFNDFKTLIKLSIRCKNNEKLNLIKQKKASTQDIANLNKKIQKYQEEIKKLKQDTETRLDFTSSVPRAALLSLDLNAEKVLADPRLKGFLKSFHKLVKLLLKDNDNKKIARKQFLATKFEFPSYVNTNTLATILFVLCPKAFPLINHYVLKKMESILGINVINTPEGYIKLANELDKKAKEYKLPLNYSMAIFDRFLANTHENEASEENSDNIEQAAVTNSLNTILYGPPGTGKTFITRRLSVKLADPIWYGNHENNDEDIKKQYKKLTTLAKPQIKFITFHQSFTYEDFIEGIKVRLGDEGHISYEIEDGIFKCMALEALKNPEKNYVLIIDEINRGNISRIFGELITLLEDDKRFGCDNEIGVTLPLSKTLFFMPKNFYIIGTMNSTDKSLTQLDLALRRRFDFIEMNAVLGAIDDIKIFGQELTLILENINLRVQALVGREYAIGHAYFMPLKNIEDDDARNALAQQIFKNKIIPLLQEYFFDDWENIINVFGQSGSLLIEKKQMVTRFSNKSIYCIKTTALENAEFYKGIINES